MVKLERKIKLNKIVRNGSGAKLKYPWPSMKLNDSFIVKVSSAGILACANAYAVRHGKKWKFITRKVKTGIRIWRVK